MIQRFEILRNEGGDTGGGGGGDAQGNGGADSSATLLGGGGGDGDSKATETAAGAWDGRIKADGTFSDAWWEKDPDLKEHGAHFSKYKTVGDALKHTLGLQQLLGKKADAVIVPGPDSPKDVQDKFREKLGVPETPEGYNLKPPANPPEGVTFSKEEMAEAAKLFHEIGITPQQAEKLLQYDIARATKGHASSQEAIIATEKAELAKQEQELTKAWGNGPEFTKNKELATRAALTAGFTMEQLQADPIFRNAGVVKALAKLGGLMSEDTLAKGASNEGFNDGYSKAMDIINNSQNPYYQRYHNGDETVRSMVQEGLKRKR